MLSFASYFVYVYIFVPLAIRGSTIFLRSKLWYQLCPVVRCVPTFIRCLQQDECKAWLEDVRQCDDPASKARRASAETFSHVQHPHDAAFCRYQSFDRIQTELALDVLECIGSSGCLEPSTYSDQCAIVDPSVRKGLGFDPALSSMLEGRWKKLYTTGWDMWPCQWTDFHPAKSTKIPPESWMEAWPNTPNVWRMDLYWTNGPHGNVTFHMCNEMYPEESWDFSNLDGGDGPTMPATLKTRAVMWGTEAHENWYLIDANGKLKTMTVYYCAYTEAVSRFDSITMVLQKEGAPELTDEQRIAIENKVLEVLGPEHGKLQRIRDCGS
jgi:hypothetical protein